jgi:hypothetical protein
MTRIRLTLLAGSLVAGATFAVAAPPASACMGEVCDSICAAWSNKLVYKLTGSDNCPVA